MEAELRLLRYSDDESVGGISESEDDSVEESEQDANSDKVASSDNETVTDTEGKYYQGKDGKTKWIEVPFSKRGRV